MPIVVPLEGEGANHTSLAIPECQDLVRMPGEAQTYWGHILLYRVAGAKWITCDPLLEVQVPDLSREKVIPMASGLRYPLVARPVLAIDYLTEGELATVKAQALRFANIYGIVTDVEGLMDGDSSTTWYLSDPAYLDFAEEVSDALVSLELSRLWGSKGLVQVDDGLGPMVTTVERMAPHLKDTWVREKREGASRDKRLLCLAPSFTGRLSFRDVVPEFSARIGFHPDVFRGPSLLPEVVNMITASGLEPTGYYAQWLQTSGLNPTSGLTAEMQSLFYMLGTMPVVDRLDLFQSATAEHLARRFLQVQRAVRKSASAPDFSGLESWTEHVADAIHSTVATQRPDLHRMGMISPKSKPKASNLRQPRRDGEETDQEEKRAKTGPKGGGKGSKHPG